MQTKGKNTRETGGIAEQLAQSYLIKKGYRILAANWQFSHLELDIVAMQGEELVIVEVKSRNGEAFGHPTDAISNNKMKQVIEAAEAWVNLSNWEKDTRFDLIMINFTDSGQYELEHFEEAFNPEA
jgi:putative endonuclease